MAKKGEDIRIIRAAKDKDNPYFQCRRDVAQNVALSWEARGMMAYLLSKPDDWKVNAKNLQQGCGKHKVYSILDELIKKRYLTREISKDDEGKFSGYTYYVYEEPQPIETGPESEAQPSAESNHVPQNGIRKNGIPKSGTHTYKESKQNTESTDTIGSLKSENQLDAPPEPIETGPESEAQPSAEVATLEPPKRQRSEKQQQLDAMSEALADAQKLPRESITNGRWNSLRKAGKQLIDVGAVPDDIPGLCRYVWVTRGYKESAEHGIAKYWTDYCRDVRNKPKVQTTVTAAQLAENAMYQQKEAA